MKGVRCEILDEAMVLVYLRCRACGADTVKGVPWEWAAEAAGEDYRNIAFCAECLGVFDEGPFGHDL